MLRTLAVLQIVGGLLGFAFLNSLVWARVGFAPTLFNLLPLSFFRLCIVAGIELWRRERRGWWLSLAAQIPQILMVSTAAVGYKLQAGPQALLMVQPSGARVWFGFGAEILLTPDTVERQLVALNLAPVVCLIILFLNRRKLREGPGHNTREFQERAA